MNAIAAIAPSQALGLYDRMCTAIAECSRVDEAKDIRDKALALEAYYRQARNLDAEREAANVRLRAERRVGELLKDLARTEPAERAERANAVQGRSSTAETNVSPSPYAAALAEQGMSRQAAHRFQALADIPQAEFEQVLSGPAKPSTAAILRQAHTPAPSPKMPDKVLWFWGRLRDFEKDGYLAADAEVLLEPMTPAMRADVLRIAPRLAELLNSLEAVHEHA